MNSSIDKRLLFEHFANKTTPLQKRQIEEWLRLEANQERFYAWLVEWENQSPLYQPDLEAPLQRFIQHTQTTPSALLVSETNDVQPDPIPLRSGAWFRWMAAASVLILLASVGWLKRDAILNQTYQTAYGETQIINLPDGSQVNLASNSSLRAPRFGFGDQTREVLLTGEASFEVTHLATNQTFVVKTKKGFDVVVHGTEFTVNTSAYRANVMLRKGKVQVNYTRGKAPKQFMLKPGDLVVLDQPERLQVQHHVEPQVYAKWKEQRFTFDNMTLRDFGKLLAETYNVQVEIPDSTLASRTLVGSFRAENANELLHTVSELFSLKIIHQDDKVLLIEND